MPATPRIQSQAPAGVVQAAPGLVNPKPSLLARYLEGRMAGEEQPAAPRLPGDRRPFLPRIGLAAVLLFANRRAVQSYPLLYTTLALAHPN